MKDRILKILKHNKEIVSGQFLSEQLGVTRVSVWKHIQKLQELGYEILATANGYRLESCPDVPYPWEFPGWESRIIYYPQLPSTMVVAKELARNDCPNFTTVIAGRQTSGRGRLNRLWMSEEGGLYFTMVLRPDLPPVLSFRVSFLASLTLARLLRELFEIDAGVKWPNDILVNERKISGMLSELEAEADRLAFINIGVGINVNNDPSTVQPEATSSRAVDVDDTGALILKCADGSLQKIIYGDCFHQS
ncbi:MAG: biotin--[acetyl-CoA-carboxylase] ligase [Desulfobacterales bacterium]